jgi:hypothetical protein
VIGRAMTQAVSAGLLPRRPGFAPGSMDVGSVVDREDLGQVSSPRSSVLSSQYLSTGPRHSYIIWRMNNRLLGGNSSET